VYGLVATVEAVAKGDQEYASIPLENLGPGTEVGLALALAYRIPVKVISPDGEAVAGARVTVGYASVGLLQQVGETGPEGQVAIGPTVPGPYVVRADADGYLPSETLTVDLGSTPLPVQTLTLVRPGRITGTVIDEDGNAGRGGDDRGRQRDGVQPGRGDHAGRDVHGAGPRREPRG
jgi:hypothetical protein